MKIGGVIVLVCIGIIVLYLFSKHLSAAKDQANQQTNTAAKPATKLQITDIKAGTGATVKKGDTVIINYTGKLQNGTVFDSSVTRGTPFTTQIGVGQVIPGWDEGIPGMKVGGERELIIPSDMAYGQQGIPGTIPPNSTLIFDVQLVNIQ